MRGARWLKIGIVVLVGLAGLAGGAYVFRQAIVAHAIERYFDAYDLDSEFRILELSQNSFEIADVAVADLRIARLRLKFSLRELREGVIRRAEIDGLSMTLNLTGEGPILGPLQRLVERDESGKSLERLPALVLRDVNLNVRLPQEVLPVRLSGAITPGEGNRAAVTLQFSGRSSRLVAEGNGTVGVDGLVPVSADVRADLNQPAGGFRFAVRANSDSVSADQPTIRVDFTGDGTLASIAGELPDDAPVRADDGNFRIAAGVTAKLPRHPALWRDALQAQSTFDVTLTDASFAAPVLDPSLQEITGKLAGTLNYQDHKVQLAARGELASKKGVKIGLNIPDVALTLDNDFAIQNAAFNTFDGRLQNYITPIGIVRDIAFSGQLAGVAEALRGNLNLRTQINNLDLGGTKVDEARIAVPLTLVTRAGGFQANATAPATIALKTLTAPVLLPLHNIAVSAEAARVDFSINEGVWKLTHNSRLKVPLLNLGVERQEGGPVPFAITLGPVAFSLALSANAVPHLTAAMDVQSALMSEAKIGLRGAHLELRGDPGQTLDGTLEGGAITQEIENRLIEALTPHLTMTRRANALLARGTLVGADSGLVLDVEGKHDITSGEGALNVAAQERSFGPGGVDGSKVSPLLSGFENLRARARGEGAVEWTREGLDSTGLIIVDDMSFRRQGVDIEGVKFTLALDRLAPMVSQPAQHVTIRRVGAGVDVTDVDALLHFEQSADGALRVFPERVTANVFGGHILAEGGTVDPLVGAATLFVKAEDFDLETLLRFIGRPEITGTGKLSGAIPITVGDGKFAITGGVLAANEAGVIQFKSPSAREALVQGGTPVTLMFNALEDFHFELLRMTIDKPAAGDTKILLQLHGNNPAVLDGQVFHLNMSLTGDADPLLNAAAEGVPLRDALITPLVSGNQAPSAP